MAGMLPGVETARRRRVHQTSIINSTLSSSLVQQRRRTPQHESAADEKLGHVARQAKSRLDDRLRAPLTKSTTTTTTTTSERHGGGGGEMMRGELTTHVYDGLNNKKKKKKKGWWKKTGGEWRGVEQRECAVCLDDFTLGDQLLNMPCAHTFHSNCLLPWLHSNTHCPCCRTSLFE